MRVHDTLASWLLAYAVLGVAWAEVFRRDAIGPSVVVIFAMFGVGAMMFGITKQAVWQRTFASVATAPFSLFFGWISVASLANLAAWANARGLFSGESETGFTIALIGIAVTLALIVSRRYRDSVYPCVVLWALTAIWIAQRGENLPVANMALASAIIVGIWTLANGTWVRSHPIPPGALSSS